MLIRSLAALTALALFAAPVAAAGDHEGKVPWVKNTQEGFAKAKRSGAAMMLFFTAGW